MLWECLYYHREFHTITLSNYRVPGAYLKEHPQKKDHIPKWFTQYHSLQALEEKCIQFVLFMLTSVKSLWFCF